MDARYVYSSSQLIMAQYPSWNIEIIKRLTVRERKYWEAFSKAMIARQP
jgi:hypothetical protein